MTPRNDHVLDYVDDFLHDLLSPEDAAYVERHCAACHSCQAALEQARRRLAVLEAVPVSEASEEMIEATMNRIDAHETRRRKLRRYLGVGLLGTVAAAAAIIGAIHYHLHSLTPTPYDLKVFGQTQFLAGSAASLRVRLTDRLTGRPLAGVPVRVALLRKGAEKSEPLAEFTTDANGTGAPRFQVPDWPDSDGTLLVDADLPETAEHFREAVRVKRSWQVMLSSDKPVYQPGQTINVRSLALRRPDLKPVAGETVTFTVADPKGNLIFKETKKSSAYGIAGSQCELASEVLEGAYTIACKVGDTESKLGVEVKKYVLPKFKVDVTLDKPYYAPGDAVKATVDAGYFFGKPVAGGRVELDVQTTEVGSRSLHKATAKTDAAGKAVLSFLLPRELVGRPQDSGDARLSVQATVIDTAGQKQTKAVPTVVTTQPLRLEVIPESGSLVDGIANRVFVMATYADGRPARVTLTVPDVGQLTTNELGVASFEVTPDASGWMGTIEARENKGITARRQVRLHMGGFIQDFLFRTDKAVYNGGETMTVTVLGGGVEPAFLDVIKDGQTLLTETINLSNGEGTQVIDLSPELFGTVRLCVYRLDAEGIPVRKTRTVYIRPAAGFEVKTTLDAAEYRPGRKAKIQFELRDKAGLPVPGALSLAAVDEAVFSVLEQRPGMEGQFYTLEQELLQPIYAIYPWSPDLTTSLPPPERDRFEQALFARTTQITMWRQAASSRRSIEWNDFLEPVAGKPDIDVGPSPHSLAASTFVTKSQEVEQTRDRGLRRIHFAWGVFFVSLGLIAYVCLWIFVRPLWVVVVLHGIGLVFLCGMASMSFLALGGKVAMAPAGLMEDFRAPQGGAAPLAESAGTSSPAVRVRQLFPETLLWRPELITDDQGRASLDIDLADSITTWRLSASAVTADGRLGAAQAGIKVFQPFFVDLNLPVSLTRGDEVAVPVVVYNYLDKPQTVTLTLTVGDWCERLDEAMQRIELAPREVRSASYRLRVKTVGTHQLQVNAEASGLGDAVKRSVEVVPDGRRVEQVVNGTLAQPVDIPLTVPNDAVEGSAKAFLKIYPSSFSQVVEGLEGIFQRPYGCFEQTSSTTYPNVLALTYLRQTGKSAPEVEAKARQYIHLGYQRLLGFEVLGGGFDWFGRPPANRTLTAYGLMEFQDMAKVHDVDPALIDRTRRWLLKQRNADGSWSPEEHGMHEDPTRGRGDELAKLSTTAYIAWAVFDGQQANTDGEATRRYLLSYPPEKLNDPYVLALVANALNALAPDGSDAAPYLTRLAELAKQADNGKLYYWEQPAGARTTFYGAGRSGSVETTALATLALLRRSHSPGVTRGALAWLVKQKDARGTWHSTQATVLALKALLAGSGQPANDGDRRIRIAWSGKTEELVIPADQAEVMKQIDLSAALKPGTQRLVLEDTSGTAVGFQVAFRYHVPVSLQPEKTEPLSVVLSYDRTELRVDDTVTATATVTNKMPQAAPMVILDLPIPAGFVPAADNFAALVQAGRIARYQLTPRSVVVYLRGLDPGKTLELKYQLRATMPVKVRVPPARAYEYYDADKQGSSAAARMTVTP